MELEGLKSSLRPSELFLSMDVTALYQNQYET